MKKISGFDLVKNVLHHANGGIDTLLLLADAHETSWLEFKAGISLLPEDKAKGETPGDLYWNIAKAIIAIANTCGGILFLGISEKNNELHATPIEKNDPKHVLEKSGWEEYLRTQIKGKLFPENGIWKTAKGKWALIDATIFDLTKLISFEKIYYEGCNIIGILIKPTKHCFHILKNDESEKLFFRESCGIGQCQVIITTSQMKKYEKLRSTTNKDFGELLKIGFPEEKIWDIVVKNAQTIAEKAKELLKSNKKSIAMGASGAAAGASITGIATSAAAGTVASAATIVSAPAVIPLVATFIAAAGTYAGIQAIKEKDDVDSSERKEKSVIKKLSTRLNFATRRLKTKGRAFFQTAASKMTISVKLPHKNRHK